MEYSKRLSMVKDNIREICHLSQMQVFATSYYQKNYFQRQIDLRAEEIIRQLDTPDLSRTEQEGADLKEFTEEELAEYDGADGKPAYVSVNGRVYDVSSVPAWAGGIHNGLRAGLDLSSFFMSCHGGFTAVLEKYPLVGTLITRGEEQIPEETP
jgi:predicted heme/steroid binding protein